jgi:hypothetical protein
VSASRVSNVSKMDFSVAFGQIYVLMDRLMTEKHKHRLFDDRHAQACASVMRLSVIKRSIKT